MIDIYNPNNENFSKNGDMPLMPLTCKVSAEINGAWTLTLSHPIDEEGRYKYIQEGAVLKVPSFNGSQLFRIKKTAKSDSGITATAEPIFMDALGDCFILDKRPTNASGQQALEAILSPNSSKYSCKSDITKTNTAYYILQNAIEAIAGDADTSFLNRWGGEIEFNNYQIIVNDRLGSDNGVKLLYGKNIPTDGISESVNIEDIATRIIPKAYNGRLLPGSSPWVDSPLINSYPTIYTKVIEYENIRLKDDIEGDTEEGATVCNTLEDLYKALTSAANAEYASGIDKPIISISCDMVLLQNTEEYKDFAELEAVTLGDTVHCNHSRLDITTDARVMALEWDCLTESVEAVTIGTVEKQFIDRVASSVNATEKALTKDGGVIGGQIEGIINGANARVIAQADGVTPQKEMVMLFENLDPNSASYGAMALGTTGFMISDTRNDSDTGWVWSTFGTGKGFSADLIIAGTLNAITITGSTLISEYVNPDGSKYVTTIMGGIIEQIAYDAQGNETGNTTITKSTIDVGGKGSRYSGSVHLSGTLSYINVFDGQTNNSMELSVSPQGLRSVRRENGEVVRAGTGVTGFSNFYYYGSDGAQHVGGIGVSNGIITYLSGSDGQLST